MAIGLLVRCGPAVIAPWSNLDVSGTMGCYALAAWQGARLSEPHGAIGRGGDKEESPSRGIDDSILAWATCGMQHECLLRLLPTELEQMAARASPLRPASHPAGAIRVGTLRRGVLGNLGDCLDHSRGRRPIRGNFTRSVQTMKRSCISH